MPGRHHDYSRVPRFDTSVEVQFNEVDAYAMVHHATYPIYLERARVEIFKRFGWGEKVLEWPLLVYRLDVRYRRPCKLLEQLEVQTWCSRARGARIILKSRILGPEGDCRAEGHVELVFTDKEGRPRRVPGEVAAALLDVDSPHADAIEEG